MRSVATALQSSTCEMSARRISLGEIDVHALRGVSLQIERGDFVAIMGSSGSGKSTLMNILGCLDIPTRGRYLLDGVDVAGMDEDDLADLRNRKIGFVFQSFNLRPAHERARQRRAAARLRRAADGPSAARRAERRCARSGWADRLRPPALRALRRPAAARRDRPRDRHQSRADPRRRADRQPRLALHRGGPATSSRG